VAEADLLDGFGIRVDAFLWTVPRQKVPRDGSSRRPLETNTRRLLEGGPCERSLETNTRRRSRMSLETAPLQGLRDGPSGRSRLDDALETAPRNGPSRRSLETVPQDGCSRRPSGEFVRTVPLQGSSRRPLCGRRGSSDGRGASAALFDGASDRPLSRAPLHGPFAVLLEGPSGRAAAASDLCEGAEPRRWMLDDGMPPMWPNACGIFSGTFSHRDPVTLSHRDLITGMLSGTVPRAVWFLSQGHRHSGPVTGTLSRDLAAAFLYRGRVTGPCPGSLTQVPVANFVQGPLSRTLPSGPCHRDLAIGMVQRGPCLGTLPGDLVTGTLSQGPCHRALVTGTLHTDVVAGTLSQGGDFCYGILSHRPCTLPRTPCKASFTGKASRKVSCECPS